MSTTIQQQSIRPGFTLNAATENGEDVSTIDGPSVGGVSTFATDGGSVVVAVDGYPDASRDGGTVGFDLTRDAARQLVSDLSAVLDLLDALDVPAVERIAAGLHARGLDATLTDLVNESNQAGVSIPAVGAALHALHRNEGRGRA